MPTPTSLLDYPLNLVKQYDNYRYLCGLFVSQPERQHLFAIYALGVELSRIKHVTSEEITQLIRFAWWRESIEKIYQNKPQNHPLLELLSYAITDYHLDQNLFNQLIEAHEDGNIEAIETSLFRLALAMLCPNASQELEHITDHLASAYAIATHMSKPDAQLVHLANQHLEQVKQNRHLITPESKSLFLSVIVAKHLLKNPNHTPFSKLLLQLKLLFQG